MNLPAICIRRPVLSMVVSMLLFVIGVVSFTYLSVRQYPAYDKPVISVQTTYKGASPQIVETLLTKPLESALSGVEGIDFIRSRSQSEGSYIDLHFKPSRTLDAAANDVRDKVGRVRSMLPDGVKTPLIKKSEADAEAIMYLALSSEEKSTVDLFNYADKEIKNELEALPGVASVDIFGGGNYVLHIYIDTDKMSAFKVTAQDLSNALRKQNVQIPAGRIKGKDKEFHVNTAAKLKTPEDFENVIIMFQKGYPIRIKDVARVSLSADEDRNLAMFNDKPAVVMAVTKKSVSNPVEIAKALKKLLPELRRLMPKDMSLGIAFDKTVFIQQSINEVYKTLFEATLCVLGVMLLFLWSFRAALIPLVTIPVSLVGSFAIMYALGFTINTMTLLAMVLAIGLVVDDAIVMLENIYRYIEEGMSPFKAALKGSQEISFAIIAMTLTLAAVYAPISLSQGVIGKVFTEFAITLAGAVILSGIIALTLSPMMCSKLLKPHSDTLSPFDRFFKKVENGYAHLLHVALQRRLMVFSIGGVFSVLGLLLALYGVKREVAPREDKGVIFTSSDAPIGSTVPYVKKYVDQVEDIFRNTPEVVTRLALIDPKRSYTWNILKDWDDRKRSSIDISNDVREKLSDITGVRSYSSPGRPFVGGGKGDSVQLVLQTTKDYNALNLAARRLQIAANRSGVLHLLAEVGTDIQDYAVDVDRDKAASLKVDVSAVGETLDTFVSGRRVTDFKRENEQFDVRVEIPEAKRKTVENLSKVYVRGEKGTMIPLSNLVQFKRDPSPMEIAHYNQLRSITLSGNIMKGYSLGDAVNVLTDLSEELLPENVRYQFSGSTKELIESAYTMYLIFFLAIVFIYLIMAAQFESFTDPFIIMFTVPLSLAGAILALYLTGGTLNVFTQIGLVSLIGLITKHGILIVDFANKMRIKDGLSVAEAAYKASLLRLRPILMTTLAMVLGALPFLWQVGAGAESRYQLGWTIFGGMIVGTLFTLFVVPVIYTFFARASIKDPNAL